MAFALAFFSHSSCAQVKAVAQETDEFDDDGGRPRQALQQGTGRALEEGLRAGDRALRRGFEAPARLRRGRVSEGGRAPRAQAHGRGREVLQARVGDEADVAAAARGARAAARAHAGPRARGRSPARRALELDAKNLTATIALAELRTRSNDAVEIARALAARDGAQTERRLALGRARARRARGEGRARGFEEFRHARSNSTRRTSRRGSRAQTYTSSPAIKSTRSKTSRALEAQAKSTSDWKLAIAVANRYGLAGEREDAKRVYESLPEEAKASEEGKRLSAAVNDVRCEDTPESRAALEKLIASDQKNAARARVPRLATSHHRPAALGRTLPAREPDRPEQRGLRRRLRRRARTAPTVRQSRGLYFSASCGSRPSITRPTRTSRPPSTK